jgi:hypothetical protein
LIVTDQFAERFSTLANLCDDSDWLEVRRLASPRRSRNRGFRAALLAAGLATAIALATPAFGLGHELVRLFSSGEPASPKVQRSFAELDVGAPPGMAPAVIAEETRKIVLPDNIALWIAPTRAGGFCLFVAGGGGGCDANRTLELAPSFSVAGPITPDGEIRGGPVLIDGSTTLSDAATIEIRFDDGDSVTVPVVWVSAPIDAGFFGYDVPASHWTVGHRPALLVLRDDDGRELRHDSSVLRLPLFRQGPSTGIGQCALRTGGRGCIDGAARGSATHNR